MPKVMRLISNLTPLTHTVEAIRCISSRGKSIDFFYFYLNKKQINLIKVGHLFILKFGLVLVLLVLGLYYFLL